MGVRNTCGATFFLTDSVIVIGTWLKGKRQYRPLSSSALLLRHRLELVDELPLRQGEAGTQRRGRTRFSPGAVRLLLTGEAHLILGAACEHNPSLHPQSTSNYSGQGESA